MVSHIRLSQSDLLLLHKNKDTVFLQIHFGGISVDLSHYTQRVMESHELYSAHLRETRTLKVYLPNGVRRKPGQPVLYCHDGLEFFTHGRIATLNNQLMAEEGTAALVIVGIAVNKAHRTDDYAPDGIRHESYNRFVTEECIPFIENRYGFHTSLDSRFMAGISLGGAASLDLYLQYPQWFHKLLLFSGAFNGSALETAQNKLDLSDLAAFMLVGQEETAVATKRGPLDILTANRTMKHLLQTRGASLYYVEATGTHLWGFWQSHIPEALRWLNRQLTMNV
ncbi:esterase family protein [Alicyclobacillaceae bacterium I2511]|nr:esterase family protein [Alicyclobacillaceae bacterium I2511]